MKNIVFDSEIGLKYNLYNSLFLTLPIDGIHQTGIRIPILHQHCARGMSNGDNPTDIVRRFFDIQSDLEDESSQLDFMFRVIQFIERQIVLVDALEDAAYNHLNDIDGEGSFKYLIDRAKRDGTLALLSGKLSDFSVRTVLTAHPTQFYPGSVLGIINDLAKFIAGNDLPGIQTLLQQLGKTPFFKKEKPTPFDEATSLIWYLENVFYHAATKLMESVKEINIDQLINQHLFVFGFWPGGDRDGNPFVNTETTLKVANRLRFSILRNYYRDIRKLRRKLTFKGISDRIVKMERALFASITDGTLPKYSLNDFIHKLEKIKIDLEENFDGLYGSDVKSLIFKMKMFGFFFASIDIRQDSRVIRKTVAQLTSIEDLDGLLNMEENTLSATFETPVEEDTFEAAKVILDIQSMNGEMGAHRYIISNCQRAEDVASIFALAKMAGWKSPMKLDIVPLFETIDDLILAGKTMQRLYEHPTYRAHLQNRKNRQPIMLGFSDGTKDGGYLSANWNIYKAKESMTEVSRRFGINVIFFDGRGGPPARGGGNTHKFYASLGNQIENKEIQLTIQGQTISSNFGTKTSAVHNLELLMTAGLQNQLFESNENQFEEAQRAIMDQLSDISLRAYEQFKSHEKFVPYLEEMSALKYYGMAKIGSRPSKRKKSKKLNFEDLRAIPFVGAWSQLKQNVPGFFGVGTALQSLKGEGKFEACKKLYKENGFFRALIENSMMSMTKTFFPLTAYMAEDAEFGSFWKIIYEEYQLSRKLVLEVSGQTALLETNPTSQSSIALREKIILPLVIIQQYALMQIRKMEQNGDVNTERYATFQKLVVRSLYGNINASRNSA